MTRAAFAVLIRAPFAILADALLAYAERVDTKYASAPNDPRDEAL